MLSVMAKVRQSNHIDREKAGIFPEVMEIYRERRLPALKIIEEEIEYTCISHFWNNNDERMRCMLSTLQSIFV
jgi:hypothetical protein